ncbi:tetratricopeptide repeat protein [Aliifodinibius sp. S!AR15-10]|uniref:tetratricopeptide repeat-containing sensor histidine kinase n=1 Tax=Aliifodinibius sp. S!AR15-10 TaxID=2950437 RepID=UPI00285BB8DB|nr:tetratricopeptide repeat protein [Aliifodinibius sp. S!AR15-10]MDR8393590.1 tetratricopeptide repeat protein [Aliifodinibius sp. S!AR15-10]
MKTNVQHAKIDTQKVDLLVEKGLKALDAGDTKSASSYFRDLKRMSDSVGFVYGQLQALTNLGDFYLVQQKYDSAVAVLKQAVNLKPEPPILTEIKNLLATSYRYQGNNQRALELYEEALSLVDTTKEGRTAAGIAMNMAGAYMNLGQSAEAFKKYHKAISYVEASADSTFLATALNNVGVAHNSAENYEEAAQYLERALNICKDIGFMPGMLRTLMNYANAKSGLAAFEEADSLYLEALELSKKVRPNTPPIQIQYNLGELKFRQGKMEEAASWFEQSLENSRKVGMIQGIYYNSTGLGNVAQKRGEIAESISWLQEALAVAERLNNPSFLEDTHQKLYEQEKNQGNFEAALTHLESAKTLSDSLQTAEQDRLLAEYRTRLDVERRERENQQLVAERELQQSQLELQSWLLGIGAFVIIVVAIFAGLVFRANREKNRINRALEEQKKELEEANDVKNKLFSIVAHDLRTPLSALLGMMELFRDESLSEGEMRTLFSEMELTMKQNMDIMENLLAWAKQQMSGLSVNIETLNANKIAEEILDSHTYNARNKQVTIKNKLSESHKVRGDYNMLKLVFRNLVSNGIKFSDEGDEVVIDASPRDGNILFEVRDTGIGIPAKLQDTIFSSVSKSRRGTRKERGSGIGLNLCKEFVEKQGGRIYFESEEGEGTAFYFSLPAG